VVRISPTVNTASGCQFVINGEKARGVPVWQLFAAGVGWAMGLGRLGSFVGPLAIGLLVSRGWQVGHSFVALGVPALGAALFTSVIGINRPGRAAEANRVAAATGEELGEIHD
jgi:MFS transporter, AAHS family, 4-hydroxybenzoate transporter